MLFGDLGDSSCEEDDGCLVEPRGTLNPEGVDLDFADGDQAKAWGASTKTLKQPPPERFAGGT